MNQTNLECTHVGCCFLLTDDRAAGRGSRNESERVEFDDRYNKDNCNQACAYIADNNISNANNNTDICSGSIFLQRRQGDLLVSAIWQEHCKSISYHERLLSIRYDWACLIRSFFVAIFLCLRIFRIRVLTDSGVCTLENSIPIRIRATPFLRKFVNCYNIRHPHM